METPLYYVVLDVKYNVKAFYILNVFDIPLFKRSYALQMGILEYFDCSDLVNKMRYKKVQKVLKLNFKSKNP